MSTSERVLGHAEQIGEAANRFIWLRPQSRFAIEQVLSCVVCGVANEWLRINDQPWSDIGGRLEWWQSAGDRRLWEMIISPKFGEPVDLVRLTRELMSGVGTDLAIPLERVAVAHFNTKHLHVHVVLRGVGRGQQEVPLPREYVRSGIRRAAEDLALASSGTAPNWTPPKPNAEKPKRGGSLRFIVRLCGAPPRFPAPHA